MPDLTLVDADTLAPEVLHAAFRDAFADYLAGPFELPLAQWPAFIARQQIELRLSRTAWRADRLLAFAFVGRRSPHAWRLATMGARPEARGSGAAPRLLDELIARAGAAGAQRLELEVFAQNERALRLYRSRGFEPRHALHGYSRDGDAQVEAPAVKEVDRAASLAWLRTAEAALPDLPLQVTARCVGAGSAPVTAWQHGRAQLVFTEAAPARRPIASLVDLDPSQQDARVLLQAFVARHPGLTLHAPPLQRADVAGAALQAAGFTVQPLHQWWMTRALA